VEILNATFLSEHILDIFYLKKACLPWVVSLALFMSDSQYTKVLFSLLIRGHAIVVDAVLIYL
jgi:hypothetical protein